MEPNSVGNSLPALSNAPKLRPFPPPTALTPRPRLAHSTLPPPIYAPPNVPSTSSSNLTQWSTSRPLPRRTSFSAGDIPPPTYSTALSDLRRSQHPLHVLPPTCSPSNPFLVTPPVNAPSYESFWDSSKPRPSLPAAPKNYDDFWCPKLPSNAPRPTSASENSFSIPREATAASTPVFGSSSRSFGSDSTNSQFSSFGNFTSSEDFTMGFHAPTPFSPKKRKKVSEPDSPSKKEHRRQTARYESLPIDEKLDKIFDVLDDMGWTLGDFMHHVFAHRDVHRSKRHASIVQRYLSGRSRRAITDVLDSWLTSPDDAGYDQDDLMYNTTTPYPEIRHARPLLRR